MVASVCPQATAKAQELASTKAEFDIMAVANANRPPEDAS